MPQLTIAAKAPLVAFPALIAARVADADAEITVVDAENIDGAAATLDLIKGTQQVFEALAAEHPAYLGFDSKWLDLAFGALSGKNFKEIAPELTKLNDYLNFRSYLSGYSAGGNDVLIWGVMRANGVLGATIKSGSYINITRWYSHLDENPLFGGAVQAYLNNVQNLRKQAKVGQKKESKASFDIDLKDAIDGQVVTRFPPEPSGYLHIGHAKAAVLNQYFAQMYHGKLIIRFDDTNPSKEKVEYTNAILKDLDLLGIKGDRVTHSSDYFQEMYDIAVQMIKDGNAYADDTPQEKMREERMDGIASVRRGRTVEENLQIFTEEMKNGTEIGLKHCLRAKISVDANNKTLRDPVVYRCNLTPHHRTGDQWKVYPTYDFCCPVVDSIEGVTHALRTIEYRDRNAQYEWMLKALKLRRVHVWDFSRVNFVRTLLSKRKLQWFVDTGRVAGWDDPRFPTVRGVRRRGMSVEGLRNFIIAQGPSKNILNLDWSLIWAINKKVIDPVSPRYTAIENGIELTLEDGPNGVVREVRPKHKKNADLGDKTLLLSCKLLIEQDDANTLAEGEEFTLMDWGNAIVTKLVKTDGKVTEIAAKLHLAGDFRKTEKKITWLANTDELTPVEIITFDHLITKDKIEEGENFEDYLTPQTIFTSQASADLNVRDLKEGDVIQFERKGYFRVDKAFDGKKVVLFSVPDGKVVSKYGAKKN